jgi:hypothetical protein
MSLRRVLAGLTHVPLGISLSPDPWGRIAQCCLAYVIVARAAKVFKKTELGVPPRVLLWFAISTPAGERVRKPYVSPPPRQWACQATARSVRIIGVRVRSTPSNIFLENPGDSTMPQKKPASKRKGHKEAVPVVGIVGVSLSLAGGASAATAVPLADTPSQDSVRPQIMLSEEEISDVSLGTFYVFDKENAGSRSLGERVAQRCGGCRGCGGRGCRGCGRGCGCRCGGGGCGGCGGCGCCLSWGVCRIC